MSEAAVSYQVNQMPYARLPKRWLPLFFRLAGLERGKVYNIAIIVPDKPDSDPQLAILGQGKVENG